MINRTCDKCGRPVDEKNSAVLLDFNILQAAGYHQDALMLELAARPRHLLPVNGCPGSPSRAQYLEGQPRDTRAAYAYDEALESRVRAAYEKMVQN